MNCDITYLTIANYMINNKNTLVPAKKFEDLFGPVNLPKRLPRKYYYYDRNQLSKICKVDIGKQDYENLLDEIKKHEKKPNGYKKSEEINVSEDEEIENVEIKLTRAQKMAIAQKENKKVMSLCSHVKVDNKHEKMLLLERSPKYSSQKYGNGFGFGDLDKPNKFQICQNEIIEIPEEDLNEMVRAYNKNFEIVEQQFEIPEKDLEEMGRLYKQNIQQGDIQDVEQSQPLNFEDMQEIDEICRKANWVLGRYRKAN